MKSMTAKVRFLLVPIFLLLIWATPHAEEKPPVTLEQAQAVLAEGEPAYSLEEANSLLGSLAAQVEVATGRKFELLPEIAIVDREELADVLRMEFMVASAGADSSADGPLLGSQVSAMAAAMLGKYGILDGVLYLVPTNMWPLLRLAGVDEKHGKSILKLVMAHELAHALQDQEVDLTRVYGITSMEESSAFMATIEGHAVFVQEAVGRELGLEESLVEMSRLLSAGAVVYDDPALEAIKAVIATQYEQIYLGGRDFIAHHYRQGGNERLWEILANPPIKTSMIARPDTYSPTRQMAMDYPKLFEGFEKQLGKRNWHVQNVEIGQMALRSSYAKMDKDLREEIVSQVEHVQAFLAQSADPPGLAVFTAIILKDAGIVRKYLTALEDYVRANVKEMESSSIMHISDFSVEDFHCPRADMAHKIAFTVSGKDAKEGVRQVFFRICRGSVILETLDSGVGLSDDDIVKIAKMFFARYDRLAGE